MLDSAPVTPAIQTRGSTANPRAWAPWLVVGFLTSAWCFATVRYEFSAHMFGFNSTVSLFDGAVSNLIPQMLLDGRVPYRDFEPRFTPAGWYVYAGILALFGENMLILRATTAVVTVVTCLLVFGLARRAGAGPWAYLAPAGVAVWGLVDYSVTTPRTMAVTIALAACGWFARDGHVPSLRTVALGGAGVGVTFLFSQNTGVFAAAAVAFALCLWSCAPPASGQPSPGVRWAAAIPVAGAGLAALVVARLVWSAPTLFWWLLAGPGLALTAWIGVVAVWKRPLTATAAGDLARRLTLLGVSICVPIAAFAGWLASQSGWEPILQSVLASAGSLSHIYAYWPSKPPAASLLLVLAWGGAGAVLAAPTVAEDPSRSSRWYAALTYLTLGGIGTIGLAPRLAFPIGSGWLSDLLQVAQGLAVSSRIFLLWLLGAGITGLAVIETRQPAQGPAAQQQAMQAMAGLCTLTFWAHVYPLADYTHAVYIVPPASVAFAVVIARAVQRAEVLWGGDPRWRRRRYVFVCALAVLPAAVLCATLVKWGTYFVDVGKRAQPDALRLREFRVLDADRANIWVDATQAAEWQRVFHIVRTRTAPDDPVLGLPHLSLVNVVADRPFPLHDVFWWPDPTGTVSNAQRQELLHVLESRRVPLIVGRARDEVHFSLGIMLAQWPDVRAVFEREYRRTETIGPYHIYELRPAVDTTARTAPGPR